MKRICTILLLVGLFVGPAWADGIFQGDRILLPAPIDDSDIIEFSDPSGDYAIKFPDPVDPLKTPIIIEWDYNHQSDEFTLAEIRAILERCREFVRDNEEPIDDLTVSTSIYTIWTRTGLASEKVSEAKQEVERLKRETELRRDIDEFLKLLTNK